ncbi:hypothetical protein AAAC51_07740 [Priestia megaterium]
MKKYLEGKKYSKDQIYSVYQTHLKKLHKLANSSDKEFTLTIFTINVIGNGKDGKKTVTDIFTRKRFMKRRKTISSY